MRNFTISKNEILNHYSSIIMKIQRFLSLFILMNLSFMVVITSYSIHYTKLYELLHNTLIVVTSDHGMPFPRIKGQIYEEGFHIPFIVYWKGIVLPGRVIDDFVNFPDVAPTFMEVARITSYNVCYTKLLRNGFVNLSVFDVTGRKIKDLANGIMAAGKYNVPIASDKIGGTGVYMFV